MTLQSHQGKTSRTLRTAKDGHGPVAVGRFVAPVAGKALKRGGTVLAAILAEWPAIAGPALASFTCPSKLTRGMPIQGESRESRRAPSVKGRSGARFGRAVHASSAHRAH